MKKNYLYIIAFTLLAGACSDNDLITQEPITPDKPTTEIPTEATEGELLIKFAPEMTDILDRTLKTRAAGASTRSGIPSTDEVLAILGAYDFERVFPVDPRNEERSREAGMHLWYLVRFDKNTDLKEAVARLSKLGEISKVQCNRTIQRAYSPKKKPTLISEQAIQKMATRANGAFPFNDTYLPNQWGYINSGNYDFTTDKAVAIAGADVNCKEAWEICTGDPSIIVAVLDEGVMWSHPDLEANMWVNESEQVGSNKDADGNGYKGDRYGYNFVKNSGLISWTETNDTGHGTHVAGTIAAVNNNGIGVSGIAGGNGQRNSGVKIMSCQVFDGNYGVTLAGEAKAIKYAADNGAVILQCSWGYNSAYANAILGYVPGPGSEEEWSNAYPLEKDALDYFFHNAGSPNGVIDGGLAIFASGNEYSGMSAFPAAYSKCLSIASIAADYTPASYTNFGSEVALSAPGGDGEYYAIPGVSGDEANIESQQGTILSTTVVNGQAGYGYSEGTSMACPHAAGVAALGLSYAAKQRRHFKVQEYIDLMKATAVELDGYYIDKKPKLYYQNHGTTGAAPTQMDLNNYRGKMGKLVNAGALLRAIEGKGVDMKVPNLYVAIDKVTLLDLARYFKNGENLTYTCTIADGTKATATVTGTRVSVKGIAAGTTTATVKVGNGSEQTITITVRKDANNSGWM